eukprot:scaffold87307_cov26-Prasinocladus_malaysianus.AAC.1
MSAACTLENRFIPLFILSSNTGDTFLPKDELCKARGAHLLALGRELPLVGHDLLGVDHPEAVAGADGPGGQGIRHHLDTSGIVQRLQPQAGLGERGRDGAYLDWDGVWVADVEGAGPGLVHPQHPKVNGMPVHTRIDVCAASNKHNSSQGSNQAD